MLALFLFRNLTFPMDWFSILHQIRAFQPLHFGPLSSLCWEWSLNHICKSNSSFEDQEDFSDYLSVWSFPNTLSAPLYMYHGSSFPICPPASGQQSWCHFCLHPSSTICMPSAWNRNNAANAYWKNGWNPSMCPSQAKEGERGSDSPQLGSQSSSSLGAASNPLGAVHPRHAFSMSSQTGFCCEGDGGVMMKRKRAWKGTKALTHHVLKQPFLSRKF